MNNEVQCGKTLPKQVRDRQLKFNNDLLKQPYIGDKENVLIINYKHYDRKSLKIKKIKDIVFKYL